MEMNDSDRSLSRRQERKLLKAAAAVARTEFDSPQRVGCPDSDTLKALACRRPSRPESADLIDHIGTCSPCFIEYSRYRRAHKYRVGTIYGLISLATLIVISLAVVYTPRRPAGQSSSSSELARSRDNGNLATPLILDLRMTGTLRSDSPAGQANRPTLRFPRTRLSLSIQLPVGSEDGFYDVALISSSGQSVSETRGEAKLQNFVEVLPVELNLSDVAPGTYELRLRRAQTEWNSYSVLIE
jgi:hypothetical protein